jgi:hypothetical protein
MDLAAANSSSDVNGPGALLMALSTSIENLGESPIP